MTLTLLPYGQSAVLVELAAAQDVLSLRNALVEQAHPAVLAVVPAARTVLVEFDPAAVGFAELQDLIHRCASLAGGAGSAGAGPAVSSPAGASSAGAGVTTEPAAGAAVELTVHYDGPDLKSVAEQCGLSVSQVIQRHCAPDYTVQFCGFAPGFGYLNGLDPALRLPRLASPRPAVPAGSVAIAGEFTGVYPRSSPGGWLLLGRTDAVLFDLARRPPALLRPGVVVRLRPA